MKVKCIERDANAKLIAGNIYEVIEIEDREGYLILLEDNTQRFYPKDMFEIVAKKYIDLRCIDSGGFIPLTVGKVYHDVPAMIFFMDDVDVEIGRFDPFAEAPYCKQGYMVKNDAGFVVCYETGLFEKVVESTDTDSRLSAIEKTVNQLTDIIAKEKPEPLSREEYKEVSKQIVTDLKEELEVNRKLLEASELTIKNLKEDINKLRAVPVEGNDIMKYAIDQNQKAMCHSSGLDVYPNTVVMSESMLQKIKLYCDTQGGIYMPRMSLEEKRQLEKDIKDGKKVMQLLGCRVSIADIKGIHFFYKNNFDGDEK